MHGPGPGVGGWSASDVAAVSGRRAALACCRETVPRRSAELRCNSAPSQAAEGDSSIFAVLPSRGRSVCPAGECRDRAGVGVRARRAVPPAPVLAMLRLLCSLRASYDTLDDREEPDETPRQQQGMDDGPGREYRDGPQN